MEYVYGGLRKSIYDSQSLRRALARRLDLPEIETVTVERESLDARRKNNIAHVYNLRFTVSRETPRLRELLASGKVESYEPQPIPRPEPHIQLPERPHIVGFGPAGMFLGLHLARKGYRPIIYERGERVDRRAEAVRALWEDGELDPESNLQFGEGGAGTWSDGKLTTGKSSPLDRLILRTFVEAGAPETILYSHKPHIGTDYLRRVVVDFRERITALGGEIRFGHKFEQLHLQDGAVEAITVSGRRLPTDAVILAMGHSARDTVAMLQEAGVAVRPKPFALGLRIEHPADFIDEVQYGKRAAAMLPAADYRLTAHHRGLSVYSFCMCPGGRVVCAASEPGGQVTNGMSRYARDGSSSNSALVVSVNPQKVGLESATEAIAFQRDVEQRAYEAGGGGYVAPAQRAPDFFHERPTAPLPQTTYRPAVAPARLDKLLPHFVTDALRAGLSRFNRTMPGFIDRGVLIGVETRTSSAVQFPRDDHGQSLSTPGLYVLGEGSGYTGGIMTSARDAVRFAQLVKERK
ncbi:MAG: NAD(P)/FAD-dependent oxidoreductase [Anaerolineales bacterium]